MTLRIFNTLDKQVEDFKPLEDGRATMYSCGPTVYDYVHIGNLRTFMMADFLKRTLMFLGYEVRHVKNITDVGHLTQDDIDQGEDKMLKAARREGKTPYDIARFYEEAFREDENKLNILPAEIFPRATEYIPQMIAIIERLIKNGYAYEIDGSVYYDVDKFPAYGQLSGNTLENLKIGARLEAKEEKKNPYDFALWLKAGEEHLMRWDSPWSVGYPGWHIECSAMSTTNLGETLDFHTGGEDNVFPHHEDEIAQSEGATGQKFVNYWVHARHLLVGGEKMSKSKGNFYTLKDIEERGFPPLAYRYLCLTSHFQSQMNFTWQALEDSRNALETLKYSFRSIETDKKGELSNDYLKKFTFSLENNLDTPGAVAITWELIKDQQIKPEDKKVTILKFDEILGFDLAKLPPVKHYGLTAETGHYNLSGNHANITHIKDYVSKNIPESIISLLRKRIAARQNKDFAASDQLREELKSKGYEIKDTSEGIEISESK